MEINFENRKLQFCCQKLGDAKIYFLVEKEYIYIYIYIYIYNYNFMLGLGSQTLDSQLC